MKTVTSEVLRWELTRIAQQVTAGARIIVTHRGNPHFALVSLADLDRLQQAKPAKPKRKPAAQQQRSPKP
ncbi:MAG: type II toxin-antitoxin system prevent-host-death family antitoxin [Planctomycetes bacterium]|nr:type II toxin-antitoxin system prevent-host-death family antitoxin [Planctomycetota bacterium]